MDENTLLIINLIVSLLFLWAGWNTAIRKHRNPLFWGIICGLIGLIGYIVLGCSQPLEYDEELEYTTENDTLGVVMLILSIALGILTIWITYGNGSQVLGL